MIRSRLFWKLFLGFALVNLLAAAALATVTWRWQQQEATTLLRRHVETAAELLTEPAATWAESPSAAAADACRELAERVGVDAVITSSAGEDFATSDVPRPELYARRDLGPSGGPIGELQVWRPVEPEGAVTSVLWSRYARYALTSGAVMIAIGYALVAHLVAPVRSLNVAAAAMADGDYSQRAYIANRDELGALARSFNQMSDRLGSQLSELRDSARRQATVLGGMIEGVIAIDDGQRVLFANAAAGKLFSFYPPQIEGRPLIEAVRNHHLQKAAAAAMESRAPQRLEIDWEERALSVQVTPLPGEPAPGAIVVLHDTTELRRLESLRRDFVANVSHELRTPLSTIKASAETLLGGAVDDRAIRTRFLEGIEEQADRLESLIQDMLQLARIESAQQPFEIQVVPLARVVDACLRDHERRAQSQGVDLTAERPEDADATRVRADPEGLRVILNNLIDNALKYTPSGGSVRVRWRVAESPHRTVNIEVADTGVGIPEEKISRVFERFYRVDEARSREMGGTGLGLSIVKHLAQSFGGGVSVDSFVDRGATFTVTLPAA